MPVNQPITLEALEVLDAIDRKGSFSAAAHTLFRVPSAVTYTVRKLEQDLRVTLFVKEGRKWVLTPAGRLLLEQGREILMATRELAEAVRQVETGWETSLRITVDSALGLGVVYPLLQELFSLQPDIEINLYEESLSGGWEALVEKRTDIAIGFVPQKKLLANAEHAIESRLYADMPWAFMVGRGHPLAAMPQPITTADTEPYRTVVVRDSVKNSPGVTHRLFSKKPYLRVPSVRDKIAAQKAGLGIGYLPVDQVQDEIARGELVPLDVRGVESSTRIHVSWHRDAKGKALQWLVGRLLKKGVA